MDHTIFRQQVLKRYNRSFSIQTDAISAGSFYDTPDQEFIAVLTRAFEEDINFRYSEFNAFPVSLLIDYITRTHSLYLNKTLHEIEQSLGILNNAYPLGHKLLEILNDFYLDYKNDLVEHIKEENELLIPYIQFLQRSSEDGLSQIEFFREQGKFNMVSFFENHEENDNRLEQIRHQIMMYEPPRINKFIYGVLLNQFELFEQDLKIHGLIEEQVLIPRALEMERKLNTRFLKIVGLN